MERNEHQARDCAGHIFFSRVAIMGEGGMDPGMGLGPMSVLPGRQREGIGSSLIREGIRLLREEGCRFIVVLGHSSYYLRFGFERASRYNLRSQWERIPDEAFMVLFLDPSAAETEGGPIHYRPEFDEIL